jgi:hypothetical protein
MGLPFEQDQEVPTVVPNEEDVYTQCLSTDHVNNNAQHLFPPSDFPEIHLTAPLQHRLPIVQPGQSAFEAPGLEFSSYWTDLISQAQGMELENPPSTPSTASILELLITPSSGSSSARNAISSGYDSSPTQADLLVFFLRNLANP